MRPLGGAMQSLITSSAQLQIYRSQFIILSLKQTFHTLQKCVIWMTVILCILPFSVKAHIHELSFVSMDVWMSRWYQMNVSCWTQSLICTLQNKLYAAVFKGSAEVRSPNKGNSFSLFIMLITCLIVVCFKRH